MVWYRKKILKIVFYIRSTTRIKNVKTHFGAAPGYCTDVVSLFYRQMLLLGTLFLFFSSKILHKLVKKNLRKIRKLTTSNVEK